MAEYPTSIGLMFQSSWPKNLDDAHCTLLYLGDMADATFSKEDIESVVQRLDISAPGEVKVTGLDLFGPQGNVLVATLDSLKLRPIRDAFESTLAKINIFNASQYKDYKPHVTISEGFSGTLDEATANTVLPEYVTLGAPELWWGNDR
jgi:2'-5' RNA ligase